MLHVVYDLMMIVITPASPSKPSQIHFKHNEIIYKIEILSFFYIFNF